MAAPARPDDAGVLAGPAHDLPGGDGDAVALAVAVAVLLEVDPLVPVANREPFRGPARSGVSTNVPCDFPGEQIFMLIATRCFAA